MLVGVGNDAPVKREGIQDTATRRPNQGLATVAPTLLEAALHLMKWGSVAWRVVISWVSCSL